MQRANFVSKPWYKKTTLDISSRRALIIALASGLLLTLVRLVPSIEGLEARLSRGVEFNVRHRLHRDPPLDPKIAIYGFGDSSLNELKEEGLRLDDWTRVLAALAEAKPRAIIVDKVFTAPLGLQGSESFVSRVRQLPVPVTAGAFVAGARINGRDLLPSADLSELIENGPPKAEALEWLPLKNGFPYGPAPEIRDAFRHIGHIMYSGNYTVQPVVRVGQRDLLPASALFAARRLSLSAHRLEADGKKVPLDSKGRTIVNLSQPAAYFDRTYKISSLVEKARNGTKIELPQDAVVMILPSLFTGSTDMQESPFGLLPGGYFVTALVNSVLTGEWIGVAPAGWLFVMLSALAGCLILYLPNLYFWPCLLGLNCAIYVAGLSSFTFAATEVPWLFSMLSLTASSVILVAENGRVARNRLVSAGESEKDFAVVIDSLRADSKQGVRLGRYHILELVGTGGMGEVYRAKIHGAGGFEKEFAVKRILAGHWNRRSSLKQFEEEARLNSLLTHANIAQVFEFFRMNETYLLVMEFIHGKNLGQLVLRAGEKGMLLPLPLSVQIVAEVCKGLDYAHRKLDPLTQAPLNIIHRDVSPQNVMLSYEGAVKLIDFGIAKGALNTSETSDGTIKGKFAYMSPEQARGQTLDQRSDLFSAGLILYELVTGTRVFEGPTDIDTIDNVRHCRIAPPTTFNPELPESLSAIISKCLAKNVEQRYPSAAALHNDLQLFLRQLPPSSLPEQLSLLLNEVFPVEFNSRANPETASQRTAGTGEEDNVPTQRLTA